MKSLEFVLWEREFDFLKTEAVLLLKIVNLMAMCGKIIRSRRLLLKDSGSNKVEEKPFNRDALMN